MTFPTLVMASGDYADARTLMYVFITLFSVVGVAAAFVLPTRTQKRRRHIFVRIGLALYFVALLVYGFVGPSMALALSERYGLPYELYIGVSAAIVIIGSGFIFFGTVVLSILDMFFRSRAKPTGR